MAALCPSELVVSFHVRAGAAGGWPQVEDLATLRVGVPPPNLPQMLGQLWGVAMQVRGVGVGECSKEVGEGG